MEAKVQPYKIIVISGVRYWCDCDYSTDNGETWKREEDDENGWNAAKSVIPFIQKKKINYKEDDYWCIEINYDSGKIKDWPQNFCIKTFFKVCDDGLYQIVDECDNILWDSDTSKTYYVPAFLALEDDGYGDYIILNINGDGVIEHWDIAKERIINILTK